MQTKGKIEESFYGGNRKKTEDTIVSLLENNNELIEFLSYNEPFVIISYCAGSRIGSEIYLDEFSNITGIHETKLIHLCGILERAGILKLRTENGKCILEVMEMDNIISRNAVFTVLCNKKNDYIDCYNMFIKSGKFPRVVLN